MIFLGVNYLRNNQIRIVWQLLYDTLQHEGLHGWICPASKTLPPPGIGSTGDPIMNLPWTFTGVPAISIPAGTSRDNLPLSLQLVGDFGFDAELLQIAKVIKSFLT